MQGCQQTLKNLKTLKSLENKHVAWKNLSICEMQNKTLKSLDFRAANYHNFHKVRLCDIIFLKVKILIHVS